MRAWLLLVIACTSGETARERFVSHPSVLPPEGAKLAVLGSPWGRAFDESRTKYGRVVTFETGRFATQGTSGWSLWDPERGFVREVASGGLPTPDGAWLVHLPPPLLGSCGYVTQAPDPPPDPTRLDPDVVVDGIREATVDGIRLLWSDTHAIQIGSTQREDDRRDPSQATTPDGTLTIDWDGSGLAITDTATGERLDPERPGFPIFATLGPNGEIAAWTDDGILHTWDSSGWHTGAWRTPEPSALSYGPDGPCVEIDGLSSCLGPSGWTASSPVRATLDELFTMYSLAVGDDEPLWRNGRRLERRADGALVLSLERVEPLVSEQPMSEIGG